MKPRLICANILVCERILLEKDDVPSLIRLADMFLWSENSGIPIEKQPIQMNVHVIGKVPADDEQEHQMFLRLVRPSGEIVRIGDIAVAVLEGVPQDPDFPRGFALMAQVAVIPKEMGTHYFEFLFDGEVVAKSLFGITRLQSA